MSDNDRTIRRFPAAGRGFVAALVLGALALTSAPYATTSLAAKPAARAAVTATINVGSKDFAEEYLISDMYQLLLQKAGFGVKIHVLGSEPTLLTNAIRRGDIDMYPEYTGTGLQVLGITRIVTDPIQAYDIVSTRYQRRFHLTWLHQSPMNDSNGVAVTQQTSRKYNLHTLSDLARVANKLTFAALTGCKGRPDCLGGFQRVYGIHFKSIQFLDKAPLRYSALKNGQADAIEVFTTDGPIKANNLVVLQDDKRAVFPADHIAPIVRNPTLTKYPRIRTILNGLAPYITTKAMIRLNGMVILQNKDHLTVARQFLRSKHLL